MTRVKVNFWVFVSNIYSTLGKICGYLKFGRLSAFFWKLSFKCVFKALNLAVTNITDAILKNMNEG